jgi:hypothetical protein
VATAGPAGGVPRGLVGFWNQHPGSAFWNGGDGSRSYAVVESTDFDLSGAIESHEVKLLRFETETALVMQRVDDADEPWYPRPLDADVGPWMECEPDFWVSLREAGVHPGGTVYFGVKELVAHNDYQSASLGADLGQTYWGYEASGAQHGFLTFARIDGVEYGAELPVSWEPSPGGPTPLALVVYPNPALTGATVSFTLDAAQEVTLDVVDLRGRRVRQRGLGPLPAGEHEARLALRTLPAGTFVVRMTGDAGATGTFVRRRGKKPGLRTRESRGARWRHPDFFVFTEADQAAASMRSRS